MPDNVEKSDVGIRVSYNLGAGRWSGWDTVSIINQISYGRSYNESLDLSVTIGLTFFSILKVCAGVSGSPYGKSFNKDSVQLTDINGDGYVDYVTSSSENHISVRYNQSGKTNLLKKVTNFTGSTIELDYNMPLACYEKPQRNWNLVSVRVRNNDSLCPAGGNSTHTRFEYAIPNHNRYERMDYGYGTVTTFQYDTDGGDSLYRYTVEEYNNVNFTKRGRKTRDCIYDAAGKPYIEHLYDATVRDFDDSIVSEDDCARADVYVETESDLTNYYEGHPTAQITSRLVRKYDRYRNVKKYTYYGDTTQNDEWFEGTIDYAAGMSYNFVSLPVRIAVQDANDSLLQLRTASYTDSGKLKQLVLYSSLTDSSVYNYTYDDFGCVDTCRLPINAASQRVEYAYQYDTVNHIYPIRVENVPLGFVSTAEYNYKFGKPIRTIDINGNEIHYKYDDMGRLLEILAPYEADSGRTYTIRMVYVPKNYDRLDIFTPNSMQSYACTFHYDPSNPDNELRTVVVTDGLGRLLQTKKDAEIDGQEKVLVTGRVVYDCFGRTVAQYHPFTEDSGTENIYNDSVTSGTATTIRYDILDRQTYTRTPMGYVTTMTYDFETSMGRQCFRTTTINPMGDTVKSLSGTLGQQLKLIAPESTDTHFKYDALGRLVQSTDPDNISTYYTYDMLGRLTRRIHPDAGTDLYHYDAAGNMTSHINSHGDSVIYLYHFNQLTGVRYPRYPANNVNYEYGTSANANINAVGKVILQEDASGWQAFKYGKLGEVVENIRTFALPFEDSLYTFRMNFKYDSWNRIQKMTYPDGEVVEYGYDRGGMLKNMAGDRNGISYGYIDSIRYDKFGLKEAVYYGNGTFAQYEYDSLQRLVRLRSTSADGVMQDIDYSYDAASNITKIVNNAPMLSTGLGGKYDNLYQYDNLYRLVSAEGQWNGNRSLHFNIGMGYKRNGRISRKMQSADTWVDGISSTTAYDNSYYYDNSQQPNTLTRTSSAEQPTGDGGDSQPVVPGSEPLPAVQQTFGWDAAGNMVQYSRDEGAFDRQFCWDEQNRLLGVKDNHHISYYLYDANGDRAMKLSGSAYLHNLNGEWEYHACFTDISLYVSPYLVATRQDYTKHYYAENERIASKIGGGGLKDISYPLLPQKDVVEKSNQNDGMAQAVLQHCLEVDRYEGRSLLYYLYDWNDSVQPERDVYFYHPDHLGSSSWITYTDGSAIQHLHYLPWGEDFVDQRLNNFEGARYTFSAKERDSETGLSYFGSRYYSSELSIWLSVDPMAAKYASLSPYVYCADNPVRCVDPNGDTLVIKGVNGTVYRYEPGGQCPSGADYPTTQYWNRLNDLNNDKAGKVVVAALHSDKATYYISNKSLKGDNTGRFSEKKNTAYMDGHYSNKGELAHELFHAYQKMNGQGGESIHNEVEAYMFQVLIENNSYHLSQKSEMNGKDSKYNSAIFELFENKDYSNFDTYFKIIEDGFKNNAIVNKDHLYSGMDNHRPNQKRNLVKQFFTND